MYLHNFEANIFLRTWLKCKQIEEKDLLRNSSCYPWKAMYVIKNRYMVTLKWSLQQNDLVYPRNVCTTSLFDSKFASFFFHWKTYVKTLPRMLNVFEILRITCGRIIVNKFKVHTVCPVYHQPARVYNMIDGTYELIYKIFKHIRIQN